MKKKLFKAFVYILTALISFVIGALIMTYYSLNSNEGFSSKYINSAIVDGFNSNNNSFKIGLDDIRVKVLDNNSLLSVSARRMFLMKNNEPLARFDNVKINLSILDIINNKFPARKIDVDGGVITYENKNLDTNINLKTDLLKHIIASIGELYGGMNTLESITMSDIDLEYTVVDSPISVVTKSSDISIYKKDNDLTIKYFGYLQGRLTNNDVIKTGLIEFNADFYDIKDNLVGSNILISGIDDEFKLNFDAGYNKFENKIYGTGNIILPNDKWLRYFDLLPTDFPLIENISATVRTQGYDIQGGGLVDADVYFDDVVVRNNIVIGNGNTISINTKIDDLHSGKLNKYWHHNETQDIKLWLNANISGFYSVNLKLKLNLFDNIISDFTGKLTLKDSLVKIDENLPVMNVKTAKAEFTTDKILIDVKDAYTIIDKDKVSLSGSVVDINGSSNDTVLKTSIPFSMSVNDLLVLLTNKTIDIKLPNEKLRDVKGTLSGLMKLDFDLSNEKILDYDFVGYAKDLTVKNIFKFNDVTSKNIKVVLNQKGLKANGMITVNNESIGNLKFIDDYTSEDEEIRAEYYGILDKNTISDLVSSDVVKVNDNLLVKFKYKTNKYNISNLNISSKLDKNSFEIPYIGWKKKSFVPSNINVKIMLTQDDAYTVATNFYSDGEIKFVINGLVSGDKNGLKFIETKNLKIDEGNLNVSAYRENNIFYTDVEGEGMSSVTIRKLLDLVPSGDSSQKTDFKFDIHNITSPEGITASRIWGNIKHDSKKYEKILTRIKLKNGGLLSYINYTPEKMNVYSQNIGLFYSLLFGGNPVKNGELAISGKADDDGYIVGEAQVKNIDILDVPEATRILKLFSVVGVLDALQTSSLTFDKIRGKFRFKDGIYKTDNISALGRTIAVSAKGYIDFRKQKLDLYGMILPSYKLGNVLSNIPVIGAIISGVDGQGPVSQKYTAQGGFEDYEVNVNPIGLLTPGILRNMFGFLFDKTEDVPVIFDD